MVRHNIHATDSSPHPKSSLNPNLESLETLAKRYDCPVFNSLSTLLASPIGQSMDGAIVCTPHSTHFNIGKELIAEGQRRYEEALLQSNSAKDGKEKATKVSYRPVNILMEKPMTTNVNEAKQLHEMLTELQKEEAKNPTSLPKSFIGGGIGCFLINHSANYRPQAKAAHAIIQSGKLGTIRHISAFFASPLSWIFDDPLQKGWNEPDASGEMQGNGFAWGQQSHLLAWIYHVTGSEQLIPKRVYCAMTHSESTGADVSHAATVTCTNGATFSLSGTSLLPGNEHSEQNPGKRVSIKIFGTKGAILYSGNDQDPNSGKLEWSRGDEHSEWVGISEIQCPELGFQFEELEQTGCGPESMQVSDKYHIFLWLFIVAYDTNVISS